MLLRPRKAKAGADRGDPESFEAHAIGGPPRPDGRKDSYRLLLPMSRLLEGVRGMMMKHLTAADTMCKPEHIAWAITVPAIWDEEGACRGAGA